MADTTVRFDHVFKVIILGPIAVGKTSLVQRFTTDTFSETYRITQGPELATWSTVINRKRIKVHLYDTSGEERFQAITPTYYRSAHGVLLVYDISCSKSFEDIDSFWLPTIRARCEDDVPIMLIGNRSDLYHLREVSCAAGVIFAREKNLLAFMETSAKINTNVDVAFQNLIRAMYDKCAILPPTANPLADKKQGTDATDGVIHLGPPLDNKATSSAPRSCSC